MDRVEMAWKWTLMLRTRRPKIVAAWSCVEDLPFSARTISWSWPEADEVSDDASRPRGQEMDRWPRLAS